MLGRLETIEEVVKNNQCTGCGGCAAALPNLLEMAETEDESRRPTGMENLREWDQAFAARACPQIREKSAKVKNDILTAAWGPVLEVWEGFAADEEIRFKGSSGGAITALSLSAINSMDFHGTLHVKAQKDNPRLNEAALSTNREELLSGAGSRYAPASICDGLHLLEESSAPNVVVGKPCDIHSVKRLAKLDPMRIGRHIGLTVSIFCAGTPSNKGTEALLDYLNPDNDKDLQQLKYRGEGWPGKMAASWKTENGEVRTYETSYAKGWGDILQKHRQWSCMTCKDHTGEYADISVGDPWQKPTSEDQLGSSLIVVRTARGRAFLRAAIAKGFIRAEQKDPKILFAAQPNLFATKGAVWGRKVAMRLFGMKSSPLGMDSLRCWLALSAKQKAQSVVGTLKRIKARKLHIAKPFKWLKTGGA